MNKKQYETPKWTVWEIETDNLEVLTASLGENVFQYDEFWAITDD